MKNIPNNLAVAFDLQPEIPRPFSTLKHLHLRDVMEIPKENPDVEQIVTITVNVEIVKTSIIKAVEVKSGDRESKGRESKDIDTGTIKTRKLEVAGIVHQKIEYVEELKDKPVYSLSFLLPFNTFVVLGEEMKGFSEFEVKGYVRDVLVKLLDKRKIYKNVILVISVSPSTKVQ
ncbi:MAG: DUF3794 domain-containing protein [Eubacteriales bacterium]|nr:DUF3794 domain-containing protein [Eubacteriales bacterium]